MPLRAILFDKDGTLVDFNATWGNAIGKVMRRLAEGNSAKFEQLAAFNHYDIEARRVRPTSPLIAGSSADYGPVWASLLGREANAEFLQLMDQMCAEEVLQSLSPIGNLGAILGDLAAKGLLLGVVTNDSEASTWAQCQRLGIASYLTDVVGYDSGHGRKPDSGQVLAFLQRHDVRPQEAMLVGDSLHDLEAARAAGVRAVAVLSGFLDHGDVEGMADHIIPSIEDLSSLVRNLRG